MMNLWKRKQPPPAISNLETAADRLEQTLESMVPLGVGFAVMLLPPPPTELDGIFFSNIDPNDAATIFRRWADQLEKEGQS